MKRTKIIVAAFAIVMLMSFNSFARKVLINTTVRSLDGCEWAVKGWIDISTVWDWPPIVIDHYDVTMSGPCGTHHFVAIRKIVDNGEGGHGIATHYYSEAETPVELTADNTEYYGTLCEVITYLGQTYDSMTE